MGSTQQGQILVATFIVYMQVHKSVTTSNEKIYVEECVSPTRVYKKIKFANLRTHGFVFVSIASLSMKHWPEVEQVCSCFSG